jgi:hypothetical protein
VLPDFKWPEPDDESDRKLIRDGDYLGTSLWFYRSVGRFFPVLQIVWPDKQCRFPWESGFDEKARELQPVLGTVNEHL